MQKIWLAHYPAGVPAEAAVDAFRSIPEIFSQSAARFAKRDAFVSMGAALTYAEIDRLSRDFAAFLQSALNLPRGARVALMMPNILQYPIALFGALRAGYAVVNCNPLYTPRELEFQLVDSGAQAIVIVENFADVLETCLARTKVEHVIVTQIGNMLGAPADPSSISPSNSSSKWFPRGTFPARKNSGAACAKAPRWPLRRPT